MYLTDPESGSHDALTLLAAAATAPALACEADPATQRAFDESLRALAEDIVRYHPGLAHLLMGMSATPCPFVHGRN